MARILVTDGEERAALAIVRSLGRAGHEVSVTAKRRRSLAGGSRFAARESALPDPLTSTLDYVDGLASLAERWRTDVLIPVTDASLHAVLPERHRFPGVTIPFPEEGAYRAASDKARVLELARSLGIAVPRQELLEDRSSSGVAAEGLRFPVVIKPSRSIGQNGTRRVKLGVRYAEDRAALARALADLDALAYPVLLQERIVGPGIGVFLLLWNGETLAAFSHERLREKPPSGGVSVSRRSVRASPELLDRSRALLAELSWRGVAMVEYKIDARTSTPYLMEINGRFWGSLQLAIDAGVDFPRLLVDAALGAHPSPVMEYEAGVTSRWSLGELDHLIARLRGATDPGGAPAGVIARMGAIGDFFRSFRGTREEVLRMTDPVPGLREIASWVRGR